MGPPVASATAATRKEGGAELPTYTGHLDGDADGRFPAELNTWEHTVLETEAARPTFVAWYRKPCAAEARIAACRVPRRHRRMGAPSRSTSSSCRAAARACSACRSSTHTATTSPTLDQAAGARKFRRGLWRSLRAYRVTRQGR